MMAGMIDLDKWLKGHGWQHSKCENAGVVQRLFAECGELAPHFVLGGRSAYFGPVDRLQMGEPHTLPWGLYWESCTVYQSGTRWEGHYVLKDTGPFYPVLIGFLMLALRDLRMARSGELPPVAPGGSTEAYASLPSASQT